MKRVAVLRGGPSREYDVSMRSGVEVINALKKLGYPYKDIVVTKKGEWLNDGLVRLPDRALDAVDVVFVALHGEYGEDGQVQKILQRLNIPFTGSRSMPSAIAFNKELTKNTLKDLPILTPKHKRLNKTDITNLQDLSNEIINSFGEELFIKPVSGGSSIGAKYIPNRQILLDSLENFFTDYDQVLVEEYIRGKEATVGVLNNFRSQSMYVLPVVEIVPPNGEPLFSYEKKYNGTTDEIVPGRFSYAEKSKLSEAAGLIHTTLGCDHYSRSDFIVRGGEVYFLEINTLPGLTSQSLFPKAVAAVGLTYPELIKHLVETATI